jgi:drug/metabolite transporter (DMT)-like permease
MLISFIGVGFLTMGKTMQAGGATLKGDIILLIGSAVFAYYTVLVKEVSKQFDALTFNMLIFVMGTILMIPFTARAMFAVQWTTMPSIAWWGLGYMVLFGSVTSYLIFAFALSELTAARVAAFSYLQPAIATSLGIWLLGEKLTQNVIIGGVLILLGVYLTERERGEDALPESNADAKAKGRDSAPQTT